jgi:hypothetical protein
MLYNVVGHRYLDFKSKEGNHIQGTNLYVTHEVTGVSGLATDKLFVRAEIEIPKGLDVGKRVSVNFNRNGGIVSISLA